MLAFGGKLLPELFRIGIANGIPKIPGKRMGMKMQRTWSSRLSWIYLGRAFNSLSLASSSEDSPILFDLPAYRTGARESLFTGAKAPLLASVEINGRKPKSGVPGPQQALQRCNVGSIT